jgi:DivIVA domain-containing protein
MSDNSGNDGRLTPDQVHSMIFPHGKLGRRGYDEEHVRAFCAQVEQELTQLLSERASLFQQVNRLRWQLRGDGNGDPGHDPETARLQAIEIMSLAQKTADHLLSEANEYVRQIATGAKQRRNQMLDEAKAKVAQMLEQAQAEASNAAAAHISDTASADDPGKTRDELAYLRVYSEVYRTHLQAYLEALLHNVEQWGRAEQSTLPATYEEIRRARPRPDLLTPAPARHSAPG